LVSQSLTNQTVLTQSYNTLKAGTYKVTITDANGCVKVTPEKTLTQPTAGLSISEVVSVHNGFSITCNGANDGSIDLTVAGGAVNYTYAWTTTDGSGLDAAVADQTGLGPGTYKVVVTDNNLCTIEKTYTLTEPSALAITETVSGHNGFEITCNGANDGSIDITASGGTSVYTYSWTTADGSGLEAAVADQTGLGPGTYKVEITDSNNCKIDKTYTITEPGALSLSQSSSDFNGFDASCSGGVDATIDLTITGGAPTYSYAWTTADGSGLDATAEDQSGLSAGTYDVTVTDLNGCQISDSFTITEPPPIVLTSILSDFNGFNISCNGESDGSIDITVSGGTISGGDTDYTYEWTTLNGTGLNASVADQTGLSAGTYTVKITDSNNCSLTRSIEILQADPIDITGVLSDYNGYNVSVKGLSDGFINITPVGGSGGYIYEWSTADGSGLIAGEQDQTGLTIGTYTLKLTDSNGCNTTKSFTLVEPTELTIDLGTDPTNILCFGDKTGVLKAIITQESVPSYKYTLNGTDYEGNVILETVSSITALNYTFLVKAGTYTITVEDLNGGKKTSVQRIFTQPAAPLAISETISDFNGFNISCTGASDATIDLTVTGGTISGLLYDYTWSTTDGSGLQPNIEDQSGLGPGTYKVIIEDENACTITKTYVITEPELIDYKLDAKNDISCFGANDGSINITVTKGTGVYNYAWTTDDGAGLDPTAEDQSGLSAGKYKLILTDGCQTLQYIYEIEEPAVLAIGLDEKVDILCFGDSTGKILVTVTGGTSPYNYEWIDNFGNKYNRDIGNVFNTGNLSNIPVGIYDLTVTDKNGCIETLKVELKEPEELKIDFNKVDVSCFNGNDGSIDVNPTGGVAPYTYTWSDFGNGKLRTDLVAGKYTVTVTDDNNCEKSVEIEIKSAPQFNITPVVTPITCFGANDGSIKLTIDGGKAPISLEWADDPQAGTTRSNLKSGVYSVLLKDSSGCEINEIYTISEPAKLQLSAIKSDALDCDDPNSGAIDLQVIGGNPPYTYSWSNGETTEDLTDVSANNYSVIVTDDKGCTVEKAFSIVRPFELKIDLTSNLRVICETRDVYLVNKVTIEGGVFPYTVKWSSGDVSGSNGEIMETNVEGSYSVEVTDNNGCTKTQIFDVVLPKLGYPEFDYTSFYWQTFGALTFNDPITFTNNSTESFLSVSWDFGDGNSSDENDPVHSYEKKGSYDVTLYVTYFSGCIYEIKKTIYVGDSYEIEFPNAFTPNSDGLNDTFRPVYYGFKSVDLQVFDTWGTLIYSETAEGANIMTGWNGMLNGKPATNGNYIFQVSGEAFNGETVLKNGPFTLLR
jgi:gliding motility-associated-like protein